jgi:prolyl 4-hydroxylase
MAKTFSRLRIGLFVSLVLGIIPAIIFTLDISANDASSANQFELTGLLGDHGLSREQQTVTSKEQSQVQLSQSTSTNVRKTPTRAGFLGADLGEPQILGELAAKVVRRVDRARKYFHETVMVEPRYEKVRSLCRNHNSTCALWAERGECYKTSRYMRQYCAPVCFSCEDLHVEAKCPLDPNAKNAWYPGDLNRMFERLATDPAFEQYSPKVMSRPRLVGADTNKTADYQLGPWVLVLDDFLSAEETDRMIEAGADVGYVRSTDVGKLDKDGTFEDKVSTRRTSTNAWCNIEICEDDPVVKRVVARVETLTKIPYNNSESLQLLRYEAGQYYKIHNDYIAYEKERNEGVRILTVFLYLSDVEEGGGTNFPKLNLTVEPKRGRALIWPSVLDEDPDEVDSRTDHQALAVIKGLKYGANQWLHQRDIKTPTALGCLDYRPAATPAKVKT